MSFCRTLPQCFNRLELVFPDLQTTLYQLKEALFRPPCADNSPAIVSRCDELIGSLELLTRVHPENRLTRVEALATLAGVGGGEVTAAITHIVQTFDQQHREEGFTYEQLLHAYLVRVRKTRLDLICARQLSKREAPTSVHLLTSVVRPKKANLAGPPSSKELAAATTKTRSVQCPLCQSNHQIWFCPELKQVQEGKRTLPAPICPLCLRTRGEGQQHPLKCFEFIRRSDGKAGSSLCLGGGHRRMHYKACSVCKGKKQLVAGGN